MTEGWIEYIEDKRIKHSFEEALKALKEGKQIHRINHPNIIYQLDNKDITFIFDGLRMSKYSFVQEEILANDWIILDKEED